VDLRYRWGSVLSKDKRLVCSSGRKSNNQSAQKLLSNRRIILHWSVLASLFSKRFNNFNYAVSLTKLPRLVSLAQLQEKVLSEELKLIA
jgi:hypothetical protein